MLASVALWGSMPSIFLFYDQTQMCATAFRFQTRVEWSSHHQSSRTKINYNVWRPYGSKPNDRMGHPGSRPWLCLGEWCLMILITNGTALIIRPRQCENRIWSGAFPLIPSSYIQSWRSIEAFPIHVNQLLSYHSLIIFHWNAFVIHYF